MVQVHGVSTQEELQKRIYQIMKDGHMNQSAVARAAGFPPSAFNAMLTGRKIIRAEYIESICKALRVTPNELYMPREQYKGA